MAVNLLHKLPLTYSENGIQYYTRNNKQVNSGKNLTKSNNHQINIMSNKKGLSDVNRINEVNISNKSMTAIEFLTDNFHYYYSTKWNDILEQAKEMEKQQQGYSEEEVRGMLIKFHNEFPNRWEIDKWFEQFKKK